MSFGERHPVVKPLLPSFFYLKKKTKKLIKSKKFYFEVTATEHCNLHCAMCSHYSPLANESYINIQEMERDIKRLKELFEGYELTCCILGGEPLLHPDIDKIMNICREAMPYAHLQLCTNGILLKKMPPQFWASLHDNDVKLIISSYPIYLDYDWILQKAKESGVNKVDRENAIITGFTKNIINREVGNGRRNSIVCDAHHRSHTLSHGKLYTCHCAANIHIFNQHFNEHFPEDNGVDIYTAESAKSLLCQMGKPCALCAYCRPEKYIVKPWAHSAKDICEWLDE